MKTYERPLVMVNNDLAEGVYAASGASAGGGNTSDAASGNLTFTFSRYDRDWGNGGLAVFIADSSSFAGKKATVSITTNIDVADGWVDGAGKAYSGKSIVLNWHSAPSSIVLHVRIEGNDVKTLQIVSASYSAE